MKESVPKNKSSKPVLKKDIVLHPHSFDAVDHLSPPFATNPENKTVLMGQVVNDDSTQTLTTSVDFYHKSFLF